MTIFYDYFIAAHPIVILCVYLFLYCCLAKYIVDLGELFSKAEQFQWNGDDFVKPSLVLTKRAWYEDKEQPSQRGLANDLTVGRQMKVDSVHRIWPQTKTLPLSGTKKGYTSNWYKGYAERH